MCCMSSTLQSFWFLPSCSCSGAAAWLQGSSDEVHLGGLAGPSQCYTDSVVHAYSYKNNLCYKESNMHVWEPSKKPRLHRETIQNSLWKAFTENWTQNRFAAGHQHQPTEPCTLTCTFPTTGRFIRCEGFSSWCTEKVNVCGETLPALSAFHFNTKHILLVINR